MENLYDLPANRLAEKLKSKTLKPSHVVEKIIQRIKELNGRINSFVFIDEPQALKAAKAADGSDLKGDLSGIPIAVKDNICVKGQDTTCSSRILKGFRPPYDATVIKKIRENGLILVGKTNMDEFAFGSSCETSCYGPTKNPWDPDRIPGGSSGGSAAAVASGQIVMAIGSDTGGSIRQPAAMCGVVGMKPTYGLVSRYGLIAFASSLDQIGPITKDVTDAAALLGVIAGHDEMDSTSADIETPDYRKSLVNDVKGLKIGIPKEYFIEGIEPDVLKAVKEAIELLKKMGAQIKEISLPHTEYAVSTYYIIAPAEASSNLARFDGVQYGFRAPHPKDIIDMYTKTRSQGFGEEAKRRILLGTYVLSSGYYEAYYLKALKVRTKIRVDFTRAFKEVDCIVTPTSPTTAFKIGERIDDPLSMYLSDIFTIPANLAGIPAISIPCGFDGKGLPIGLQIIADAFKEENIFTAAYAYEQNTDWHSKRPGI
ncbi:MAG: Asp-tRNA(Asn)/Glu-tRNA(Gln) amidotransferase subunit GatA [Candidatus Omnitrophica bacterium]|nr:Asp-tRNA(Asn)/Glu-tRNA(Gln) amidotransferase subunit GatA [Candidatus Omnitrophota bacterium]